LLYLAKDVRVGLNPEELQQNSWSPEQQLRQEHFLKTAVAILGEEQTQKQLMNALLETRRDVLSNPNALNEVVHQGVDPMAGKRKKKWHKPQFNPLSTTLLDDVVEKMNDEQFDVLVQQLTAKNGGNVPLGVDGFPISLKPIQPMLTGKKKPFEQDNGQNEENSNQNEQTISNNDDITANTPSDPTDPTTPALVNNNDHNPDPKTPPLPSFNQIKSKPITKSELVKSFKLSSTDIMDAVSLIPSYHQAQAVTALAAALPFDPAMPLASPTITPLRSVAIHTRDHTPLREVLSHTLSSGVIDADPSIRVYDPFCGSGTLVIESVFRFLGLPLQPLQRPFAFENWPIHDEYQYNALMWEWKGRYQHIVKDFIKTFGITKYQTLNGDFSQIEGLKNDGTDRIVDFPLFVGTDLRHKSVRASISNANNAGINYFTHFFQSDFQKVIYEANRLWKYQKEEEDKKLLEERLAQESARNINDDFFSQFSGSLSHSPSSLSHSQSSNLRPKNTLLSLDDALDDMLGESIPGVPQQRKKQSPTSPLLTPTLPLTKPYLKGYTMFSNIPWGVVDEKPDRWSRKDDNATRYANTTQQEPVEDLYIRMGRTLHDNKDLFRDVFVLSAHQKFEKLTAIGAQRQARDNERKFGVDAMIAKTQKQQPGLVKFENGVSIYSVPKTTEGTLEWDNVSTFYNNGVKTHLLKLRM
jgi:23S rRNA G2445 N2-methylase RlmL